MAVGRASCVARILRSGAARRSTVFRFCIVPFVSLRARLLQNFASRFTFRLASVS